MRELHVRLTDRDYKALELMARRHDRKLSSMIRVLIRERGREEGCYALEVVSNGTRSGHDRD